MQARGLTGDADLAEIMPERGKQVIAALFVADAGAQQVRRIRSRTHHPGQHRLFEPGRAAVEEPFCGSDNAGKLLGHDHVAEPQACAQRARERAEVNGAVRGQRSDRLKRRAFVAQIAVAIVFQDVAAVTPRPRHQRLTAGGRQRMSGGKLVRGRDVNQRRRPLRQLFDDQALEIDRDARYLGTGRLERERRSLITRVLDRTRRAVIEKQPRGDADALLRTVGDDDAARIGRDPACGRKMIGNRRAQRRQSGRIAVVREPGATSVRKGSLQQPAPGLDRKRRRARASGKKVEREAAALLIREVLHAQRQRWHRHVRQRTAGRRFLHAACQPDRRPGQIVGDKNPRGGAGFDVALNDQGVVGADDRIARNRKLFGQPPRRWQSRAGANPRVADGVAKLLDELRRQWFAAGTIEEHGYLHERKKPPRGNMFDRPGTATIGATGNFSKRGTQLVRSIDSQLDLSHRLPRRICLRRRQILRER